MTEPFRATNVRPENAVLVYTLDLKKNKAAMWGMNLASIVLLFFFGWLFSAYVQLVRPGILAEVVSHYFNSVLFVVSLLAVFAVMIVVHELFHGLFFWVFSRRPPKFGLRGWYAFACAPGWFFPSRQYLVIGLAPFVLISLIGLILLPLLPVEPLVLVLLAVILNAASSVGDLWIILKLVLRRGPVAVEDVGDGMSFYSLGVKK